MTSSYSLCRTEFHVDKNLTFVFSLSDYNEIVIVMTRFNFRNKFPADKNETFVALFFT